MCEPASFYITKDSIFWSTKSDNHTDIVQEFKLHEDGSKGPNGVKIEITPEGKKFLLPLDQWKFKVDQDIIPKWFDSKEAEERVRRELPNWLSAKIILPEVEIEELKDRIIVACYGKIGMMENSQVGEMRENSQVGVMMAKSQVGEMRENSQVRAMMENSQVGVMMAKSQVGEMRENSQVGAMMENSQVGEMRENSQVREMMENSQVRAMMENSQVRAMMENSQVRKFSTDSKIKTMDGEFTAILDYTGKVLGVIRAKKNK